MASLHETAEVSPTAGELNAAISNAVVGLLSEYVGRGPTKARTTHSGRFVLCVLEDTLTKAERSLAAVGDVDRVTVVFQQTPECPRGVDAVIDDEKHALTAHKAAAFLVRSASIFPRRA